MEFVRQLARPIIPFFTLFFLYITVQTPAFSEMVSTQNTITKSEIQQQRVKILKFYERRAVKSALQKHGLSPVEAKARVAKLSDVQIQQLSAKIDKIPAGAGAESILVVFLILVILELMGITNLFSFI
ncbi:hypothetical protein MNBD_GAMMA12-337 [hydrothermal vent metagenome]|uniref:PA2779 family protein n=1 Tax=hydrothermal vent metagenome TaxID=652676 RepID=A0A3B0Y9N6_9ZZZZ